MSLEETNKSPETAPQLSQESANSQRMDALTRLVGGLCHDFNNFLTIIDGHSSVLRFLEGMPPEAANSVEEIKSATKRASSLTQQMLAFAQRQRLTISRFSIAEMLESIQAEMERLIGTRAKLCIEPCDAELYVDADRELLKDAILHLVKNARDAVAQIPGSVVKVGADRVQGDRSFVRITVHDQGVGIKPELLPFLFDPYFTTKSKGAGKGLGLSLVYGICKLHGGKAEISSNPINGTTACILLPIAKMPTVARPVESDGGAGSLESVTGTETLFVIEDNENLRMLIISVLEKLGYTIYGAESVAEARVVWDKHHDQIVLALIDLVLPEGRVGIDLAEEIVSDHPTLHVILMSGFVGTEEEREKIGLRKFPFIAKPFDIFQLAGMIRGNIDGKRAS